MSDVDYIHEDSMEGSIKTMLPRYICMNVEDIDSCCTRASHAAHVVYLDGRICKIK